MKLSLYNVLAIITLFTSGCSQTKPLSHRDKLITSIVEGRQRLFNPVRNKKNCSNLIEDAIFQTSKSSGNVKDLDSISVDTWLRYLKCPKTRYESVFERSQLELYRQMILEGINTLQLKNSSHIEWAPTRCPCFNAQTFYLGKELDLLEDCWLIEVNYSIGIIIGEYGKIAAYTTPFESSNGSVQLNTDPKAFVKSISKELFQHFVFRLLGHINNDPVLERQSIPIGNPYLPVYNQYATYANIFAIAHELSHVLLRHNFKSSGLIINTDSLTANLPLVTFTEGFEMPESYRREFQADSLGFEIMLASIKAAKHKKNNEEQVLRELFGFCAADVLLSWFEIFQEAEIETYGHYIGEKSHPPAKERRERIKSLAKIRGNSSSQDDICEGVNLALNSMWQALKPNWKSLVAKSKGTKKSCTLR